MRTPWIRLPLLIGLAAALTLVYTLSILLEFRLALILTLYLAAAVTTLWMAFRILKDPYATDKTFDEYFYQDREDLRRNGPEE